MTPKFIRHVFTDSESVKRARLGWSVPHYPFLVLPKLWKNSLVIQPGRRGSSCFQDKEGRIEGGREQERGRERGKWGVTSKIRKIHSIPILLKKAKKGRWRIYLVYNILYHLLEECHLFKLVSSKQFHGFAPMLASSKGCSYASLDQFCSPHMHENN